MIRKALFLCFAWYALAFVLSGCDNCKCPPQPVQSIRWTSLGLSTYWYETTTNNSIMSSVDRIGDFRTRDYLLQVSAGYEFLASNCNHRNALISEAYACDCIPPEIKISNPMTDLRVFTVGNYDNEHPAGSEITDRFGSPLYSNGQPLEMGPLTLNLNTIQYNGGSATNVFDLYMTKKPEPGIQQFRVVVTLQDSTSFTELTPELLF